jgi:hemerythrin-like domain-containing protein
MEVATEMTNIHNALLRGLNAIYLQCPQVTELSDTADFMLYVKAWGDLVHHHHNLEETILFPEIENLAKKAGKAQAVMATNLDQHHKFEAGLLHTIKYAGDVLDGRVEYNSTELKGLIDGFASELTQHLHDEIETLTGLEDLDGFEVKKHMDHQSDQGQKTADRVRSDNRSLNDSTCG